MRRRRGRLILARCLTLATLSLTAAGAGASETGGAPPSPQLSAQEEPARPGEARVLGALSIPPQRVDGAELMGLSGLAWDEDEGLLYALSDRGTLFHLRPHFTQEGRLADVEVLSAHPLRGPGGDVLTGVRADAEGLAAIDARNGRRGDTRLLVAFERRPRILEVRPDGSWLATPALPAPLNRREAYAGANQSLEAVASHPVLGILTAPEQPLRGADAGQLAVYALDGRVWHAPRAPHPNSALTEMEVLPDGSLLLLERAFELLPPRVVIWLRQGRLGDEGALALETRAVLDSSEGWHLDNFEGLARHRARRFFLVSDDNGSPLQNTLLIYLEVP